MSDKSKFLTPEELKALSILSEIKPAYIEKLLKQIELNDHDPWDINHPLKLLASYIQRNINPYTTIINNIYSSLDRMRAERKDKEKLKAQVQKYVDNQLEVKGRKILELINGLTPEEILKDKKLLKQLLNLKV